MGGRRREDEVWGERREKRREKREGRQEEEELFDLDQRLMCCWCTVLCLLPRAIPAVHHVHRPLIQHAGC